MGKDSGRGRRPRNYIGIWEGCFGALIHGPILSSPPTRSSNAFGKRADKNRKLYNGRILTYLYQYFGPLQDEKTKNVANATIFSIMVSILYLCME